MASVRRQLPLTVNPRRWIVAATAGMLLLASLTACAPPAAAPTPAPSSTPAKTSSPTPTPTAPVTPSAPAVWDRSACLQLIPESVAELALGGTDLVAENPPPQSPDEAALQQIGAVRCDWVASDRQSGIRFTVLARGAADGRAHIQLLASYDTTELSRSTDSTFFDCGVGDAGYTSQCTLNLVGNDQWAEATIWSTADGRTEEFSRTSVALESALAQSLPSIAPGTGWVRPADVWRLEDCAELDATHGVAAATEISDLTYYQRSRGADTQTDSLAWDRTGFLMCSSRGSEAVDLSGYGPSVTVLPGGGWAWGGLLDRPDWESEVIGLAGADHAAYRCVIGYDYCVLDVIASDSWFQMHAESDLVSRDVLEASAVSLVAELNATAGG